MIVSVVAGRFACVCQEPDAAIVRIAHGDARASSQSACWRAMTCAGGNAAVVRGMMHAFVAASRPRSPSVSPFSPSSRAEPARRGHVQCATNDQTELITATTLRTCSFGVCDMAATPNHDC